MFKSTDAIPTQYHHIYQQLKQLIPDLATLEHGVQRFSQGAALPTLYLRVFGQCSNITLIHLAQCKTENEQVLRDAEGELLTTLAIECKLFHPATMARTLLWQQTDTGYAVCDTDFDPVENYLMNEAAQTVLERWQKQGIVLSQQQIIDKHDDSL